MKPTALISARLACGASHRGLVSMLSALFRRNVFRSRCVTFRLSAPKPSTEGLFAILFRHRRISVSCPDLTMNGSQRLAAAMVRCYFCRTRDRPIFFGPRELSAEIAVPRNILNAISTNAGAQSLADRA